MPKVEKTLEVYKTLLKDAIEAKQVRWEALSNVNELLEACHSSGDFHMALGRLNLTCNHNIFLQSDWQFERMC